MQKQGIGCIFFNRLQICRTAIPAYHWGMDGIGWDMKKQLCEFGFN